MKKIIAISALLAASSAFAALATFTGRMEMVTTVTGQAAIRCEYQYLSQKFWKLFPMGSYCPPSIEVM